MRKIIKIALAIILLVVFAGTLFYLYKKSRKKPEVFSTQTAFVSNIIKKTVATGSVVPYQEVEIKPKVSGIVEKIYVEAGEMVRKGDLIARVKIIPDMVNLNNAESRVNKAQLSYDDAKLVYDRQKKVYEKGVISEAEFQQYRLQYNTTREELESAESNLQLIKEGVTKRAGVATNTLIRSTIDGMVLDVPVEEGKSVIESNTFNDGTTIASIADMGKMIFEGKVDETEVGKIKPGMKLILSIGAIEGETFDATLTHIAPKGVEENGAIQFKVKADVTLREGFFIRSGYSANADIVLDRRDSVLCIPESLVTFGASEDSTTVDVETLPQVFEKRTIKTGLSDGINIEILSGLTKDDKIKAGKVEEKKPEQPAVK